jgi:hypothetical protein
MDGLAYARAVAGRGNCNAHKRSRKLKPVGIVAERRFACRTFDIAMLECPNCHGRMKLLAMITDGKGSERYLAKLGEPTTCRAARPAVDHRTGRAGFCA